MRIRYYTLILILTWRLISSSIWLDLIRNHQKLFNNIKLICFILIVKLHATIQPKKVLSSPYISVYTMKINDRFNRSVGIEIVRNYPKLIEVSVWYQISSNINSPFCPNFTKLVKMKLLKAFTLSSMVAAGTVLRETEASASDIAAPKERERRFLVSYKK